MAISSNNLFTDGFRGTVGGNMTFRKRRSGRIVVGKKRGTSTLPPTEGQRKVRETFRLGIVYAKAAMTDPSMKALYAAVAGPDQSAYNMALKDACKPPQVLGIDAPAYSGQAGQSIMVKAIDDFKVASVQVTLRHAAGDVLEAGAAVLQPNGLDWVYTTTVANGQLSGTVIVAVAKDTPGNEGSMQITL